MRRILCTLATFALALSASTFARPARATQLDDGITPLMRAIRDGETDDLKTALSSAPNVNRQDPYGWTALHYASARGDGKVARQLLQRGATVDPSDSYGATPLMIAARWGRDDVAKLLLESGADPGARDAKGKTAIDYAIKTNEKDLVKLLTRPGFPAPSPAVTAPPDDKVVKAKALNRPEPRYTSLAVSRHFEGKMVVTAVVGANGFVQRTRILFGLPYGLSAQAVIAVRQLRFEPATKNGTPVESDITILIRFSQGRFYWGT